MVSYLSSVRHSRTENEGKKYSTQVNHSIIERKFLIQTFRVHIRDHCDYNAARISVSDLKF